MKTTITLLEPIPETDDEVLTPSHKRTVTPTRPNFSRPISRPAVDISPNSPDTTASYTVDTPPAIPARSPARLIRNHQDHISSTFDDAEPPAIRTRPGQRSPSFYDDVAVDVAGGGQNVELWTTGRWSSSEGFTLPCVTMSLETDDDIVSANASPDGSARSQRMGYDASVSVSDDLLDGHEWPRQSDEIPLTTHDEDSSAELRQGVERQASKVGVDGDTPTQRTYTATSVPSSAKYTATDSSEDHRGLQMNGFEGRQSWHWSGSVDRAAALY